MQASAYPQRRLPSPSKHLRGDMLHQISLLALKYISTLYTLAFFTVCRRPRKDYKTSVAGVKTNSNNSSLSIHYLLQGHFQPARNPGGQTVTWHNHNRTCNTYGVEAADEFGSVISQGFGCLSGTTKARRGTTSIKPSSYFCRIFIWSDLTWHDATFRIS